MARIPQQNRVAESSNRTLIEAARTMLANSKLPTTFWAEAVNTTCYVQNRVLVVKPYFKTPYELFRGRSHALSFIRPFGCHVTILNTLDQLGKLDGKSNEGIFVGYSTISKAFRVYNTRTRKSTKTVNTAGQSINTANASYNTDGLNINTVSPPVNTATPTYADYPIDHLMPNLEDTRIFDDAYDDRDEGAEADYNNLEIVISVSPFLSTHVEPKKVTQALDDESWVETMQEELLQLKLLNFWTLQSGYFWAMHHSWISLSTKWKKLYMVFIKLLEPVKRIFRYFKGQPTLGLRYPKDSPLELIAYSDSDYAGANLDRKSTTKGCQFLGLELKGCLINDGCANLVKMLVTLLILLVTLLILLVFLCWFSPTQQMVINSPCLTDKKELAILGQTETDLKFVDQYNMVAYLAKSDDNTEFHQIVDFLSSCSINYALTQIHVIIDGKAVVISESSVRSDLFFDDKYGGDSVERAITTDASLVAAQDSDSINKTQTTTMPNIDIPQGMDTGGSLRRQEIMGGTPAQTRVTTLENELSSTKVVYHKALITLTKRVKKLETQLKQKRSRTVIHSLDEEEPSFDVEDSLKHGRMIGEIDKDENINLVSEQAEVHETAEPLKDDDDVTFAETLLNIKRSTTKDKGKGIMQETELPRKIKKREMIQLSLDEELAQKLHAKELGKETARQEQESSCDCEDITIDVIPLATKPPVIVEYKIVKEGKISTYHIIRADGSTKRYNSMIKLLENIDREYLETLWKLVKDKHGNKRPKEEYERVL
nr:retrovirus-related Pol polyprotein from transposon TNT 1-94 [Tanacetum cinerariifolium]